MSVDQITRQISAVSRQVVQTQDSLRRERDPKAQIILRQTLQDYEAALTIYRRLADERRKREDHTEG